MDPNKDHVRRVKVDPADAKETKENRLPGQIPVDEAERGEQQNPQERQPDPVQAEQAVNPELENAEKDRPKNPAGERAKGKNRG